MHTPGHTCQVRARISFESCNFIWATRHQPQRLHKPVVCTHAVEKQCNSLGELKKMRKWYNRYILASIHNIQPPHTKHTKLIQTCNRKINTERENERHTLNPVCRSTCNLRLAVETIILETIRGYNYKISKHSKIGYDNQTLSIINYLYGPSQKVVGFPK